MKSTVPHIVEQSAPTVAQTSTSAPASGQDELVQNYLSVIRGRGIRHPVSYEFSGLLGSGRQGQVFLALRRGARGCVTRHAIKVFDPGIYASDEQYWEDMGRIATQVSLLQTMHNPNLLARDIYDEVDGIGYVQMEEIDGIELQDLLNRESILQNLGRLPPEAAERFSNTIFHRTETGIAIQPGVAVHIMRQILRGLEALHHKGFVHSDIKPSNVMIDRLGFTRIIDHGRASRHGEDVSILLGSPVYMAPECHRRAPAVTQSDLYSLGLVGLEMLRGEALIANDADVRESDLARMKADLPLRLHDLLPDYVRENDTLRGVLQGLLAVDPKKRFNRVEDVASGTSGLPVVHRQLAQIGKDVEYDRELQDYVGYLVDPASDRVRRQHTGAPRT